MKKFRIAGPVFAMVLLTCLALLSIVGPALALDQTMRFSSRKLPSAQGWYYGSSALPWSSQTPFLEDEAFKVFPDYPVKHVLYMNTMGRDEVGAGYARDNVIDTSRPLEYSATLRITDMDTVGAQFDTQVFTLGAMFNERLHILQVSQGKIGGADLGSWITTDTSVFHSYTMEIPVGGGPYSVLVDGKPVPELTDLEPIPYPGLMLNQLDFGDGTGWCLNGAAEIESVEVRQHGR
jgi:hypothetical protein